MEKMGPDGPKWGQEDFCPTNPDLADILGYTDFDFETFYFLDVFGSQISRFPGPRFLNFQKSGLGPAWARLGPGLGPGLGPAWAWAWAQAWARPLIEAINLENSVRLGAPRIPPAS